MAEWGAEKSWSSISESESSQSQSDSSGSSQSEDCHAIECGEDTCGYQVYTWNGTAWTHTEGECCGAPDGGFCGDCGDGWRITGYAAMEPYSGWGTDSGTWPAGDYVGQCVKCCCEPICEPCSESSDSSASESSDSTASESESSSESESDSSGSDSSESESSTSSDSSASDGSDGSETSASASGSGGSCSGCPAGIQFEIPDDFGLDTDYDDQESDLAYLRGREYQISYVDLDCAEDPDRLATGTLDSPTYHTLDAELPTGYALDVIVSFNADGTSTIDFYIRDGSTFLAFSGYTMLAPAYFELCGAAGPFTPMTAGVEILYVSRYDG